MTPASQPQIYCQADSQVTPGCVSHCRWLAGFLCKSCKLWVCVAHWDTYEARQVLRWAAQSLNPTERAVLSSFVLDRTMQDVADQLGISRGGAWMAKQSGLERMRRKLLILGITSSEDLLL